MDRQLLARATDSSDAPTPGYLYLDLAKNAASSPTACQEMATYLIRKLEQKSHYNIKHKCCKVMAQLSVSPVTRGQFKRCLAQDANAVSVIKEHLQFRGPPDPARGDEIYERVRVAAKEALDAIYSDTPSTSTTSASTSSHYDNHSSPYGGTGMSTSHHMGSAGGSGGGGGPRRMEGIGNPMFADPRLTQRPHNANSGTILKEVMREAGQTLVGMIKDPLARNVEPPRYPGSMPRPGNAGGGYGGPGYGVQPPGRAELVQATGGQWTMASNRGPNSFGPTPNGSGGTDSSYYKAREAAASGNNNAFSWAQQQASSGTTGVGGSWASSAAATPDYATPTITITSASVSSPGLPTRYQTPSTAASTATNTPSSGGIVSDGSYERTLVLELCPPGGMKAEPPPDKLASFAKAVASLNPDLVCPVLLDCLEEGQPWLIRAKALHVMDTCIQNGRKVGSDENPYANFFYACRGEIEPLAHHARSAIREPAKRVLESLGIPVVSETTSTAFAQQQQSSAPVPQYQPQPTAAAPVAIPNLLDFDDDVSSSNVAVQPTPVPTAPPPASAPPPPSPDAPSAASASLFGGLKVQAPASAAVAPAPTSGNLLGDFSSPTAAAPSAGGLFGDVVVKQPAAAAAAAPRQEPAAAPVSAPTTSATDVASLLDELSIPDQPAAANGSAFGFINQSAAPTTAASHHPPALSPASSAAAVPPKQSFDPLLNPHVPSPNTARAMMQLSQEQMKAMAYQQMIMQQQLQMAMALQHQQQQQQHPFLVGGAPPGVMPPGVAGAGGGGMPKPMMGVNAAAAVANSPFSFLENNAHAKQDDKRFDFVKDAMKHESKK